MAIDDKMITDTLNQSIIRNAWADLLSPDKDDEEALDKMMSLLIAVNEPEGEPQ